ncbi:MAG: GntR family transcriptional regulator, partial [Oscillospiraceae bacterium]|nr:GntR family transcriptional regulator [Oscillospiraceae bacterium]
MEKTTRYRKIYNDLLGQIRSGQLKPGDKVPTEEQLSATYSVSRITSKKAVEMLAGEGLVTRTPGRGTFVAPAARAPSDKAAPGGKSASLRPGKSASDRSADGTAAAGPRPLLAGVIMSDFSDPFGMSFFRGTQEGLAKHGGVITISRAYNTQQAETAE